MKVTGFKIAAAIERHQAAKGSAESQFKESLMVFEGEDKGSPQRWDDLILKHDRAVAVLQAAQARLNALVVVDRGSITLAEAIKILGVEVRRAARWKEAAGVKEKPARIWERISESVRSKENVYAKPAVTPGQATELLADALAQIQALRAAIALGNAQEIEIPVDPGLLA